MEDTDGSEATDFLLPKGDKTGVMALLGGLLAQMYSSLQ
jgi:hypothetical protein